jgi:hypothetical protein
VDQAVISEADFRKAVASQSDTRGKKHKAFVFVHGFNNNFQESLFRLAQLQADAKIDGIPILFSWPSQGQVAAYETDKEAASYSRSRLMTLLKMLSSSPEVSAILVVAHSMGAMLTVDALLQLRIEGINRVIARLGGVLLAAPDINAQTFRDQVTAIGPLKPPLLVLVSKDGIGGPPPGGPPGGGFPGGPPGGGPPGGGPPVAGLPHGGPPSGVPPGGRIAAGNPGGGLRGASGGARFNGSRSYSAAGSTRSYSGSDYGRRGRYGYYGAAAAGAAAGYAYGSSAYGDQSYTYSDQSCYRTVRYRARSGWRERAVYVCE